MEINFEYFQIQKWILQTIRSEKVDEKNEVICVVLIFSSWVMVLKLSKKVHFLRFCADFSKKFKSIKAIYIYASKMSLYSHSENGIVYYDTIYSFWVCWVSIFFYILIANISWMVARIPINHTIFWRSVMRRFRCIYVNCFKRLRFLAEVSTKL